MAEILGAVASGLAVAEVGLKAGGTVWKLKRLWQEVHDVPATIQDLMRQIEMMDPILSDHETNFGTQSIALPKQLSTQYTAPAMLSAAYCREALNDLRRLVEDLDGAVESEKRSRRTFARMRVVLKKDIIKGFQDRLERAIRLLQSTQVSYLAANATITGAMMTDMWTAVTDIQAQQQLILQQLGKSSPSGSIGRPPFPFIAQHVEMSQEQTPGKRKRFQRQGNSISLPWSESSMFGALIFRKSEAGASGEATYTVRFQLPRWLSQSVWDININRACSGWQGTLSTWNIVPDDSPGMLCVKNGDLDGLLDLFHRGLASPRDCDADGYTLFNLACLFSETHIVKHLISMDATRNDITALNILTGCCIILGKMSLDTIQPLLSSGSLDPLLGAAEDLWDGKRPNDLLRFVRANLLAAVARKPDLFGICFRACFPYWQDLPPRSKQEIAALDIIPQSQDWTPDGLRFLFCPNNPIQPIDTQAWINDGASLLHLMFTYYLRIPSKSGNGDWDTLIEEVIKATDDTHHIMKAPHWGYWIEGDHSAFEYSLVFALHHLSFLAGLSFDWHERHTRHRLEKLTANLQSLMSILARLGHDLLEFGRKEALIWATKNGTDTTASSALYLGIRLDDLRHVEAVHYGADPRNWYFEMSYPYEDYVGAFWNLIENPHLFRIPGAWIDE